MANNNEALLASESVHEELDLIFQLLGNENDLLVIDNQGFVLRTSEFYGQNYGIGIRSIVGCSIYQLEDEGVFRPSVTALALKEQRKITLIQTTLRGDTILATGVPIFDKDNRVKYVAGFNSIHIEGNCSPPERLSRLRAIVDTYYTALRKKHFDNMEKENLIFKSPKMHHLYEMILQIADTNASVLLTGETGTGKSKLAQTIHNCSLRRGGPFITINCGAIPESLIESELFGYVGGAFTGANPKGQLGKIEAANGGTLFLDEIGDMPQSTQVRLLQVLQEHTVTRIGSTTASPVNFRLICATNRILEQEVNLGKFRSDLYFRINVIPIKVPALRERREDIVPLANSFLNEYNLRYQKSIQFSEEAFHRLEQYDWPGNIRELQNWVERVVIMATDSDMVSVSPPSTSSAPQLYTSGQAKSSEGQSYAELINAAEREIFLKARQKYKTSVAVAKALGISQTTAARKLRKYTGG